MTSDPAAITRLLRRSGRELRLRRAERGAWRGAFWGALAAVAVLAMKASIGASAVVLAVGLLCAGALAGALLGACRRVGALEAARLADRALGLEDRVATSVEYADRGERSRLVGALLADTAACLAALPERRLVARVVPREGRLVVLPLLAALALAVAPPLPAPPAFVSEWFGAEPRAQRDPEASPAALQQRGAPGRDLVRRDPAAGRGAAEHGARSRPAPSEQTASYRDKSLATPSADFASFVQRSDARLRVLTETEKLPDLKSDFTSSRYRSLLRKHEELSASLRARHISPEKLAALLAEMERLGRRIEEELGEDAFDGYNALDRGQADQALEALENALGKLRDQEARQRDARRLRGGREPDPPRGGAVDQQEGALADAAAAGEGPAPGLGTNPDTKGKPTARLRSTPYTSGVRGAQRGRLPMYETQSAGNATGEDGSVPAIGVFGQYRRMMEEAIAREQVPRDYHEQVRDYFKALGQR